MLAKAISANFSRLYCGLVGIPGTGVLCFNAPSRRIASNIAKLPELLKKT
jgi:hypothetical protein